MARGWIKLWRKLLDNPWLRDANRRSVFVTLLLRAQSEDREVRVRGHVLALKRGQHAFCQNDLAAELRLSRKQIRAAIGSLKQGRVLVQEEGHKVTVVTICNYSQYQSAGPTEGQPKGQPKGQQRANRGPTEQEREEYREDKRDKYDHPGFSEFWNAFPRKVGKPSGLRAFKAALWKSDLATIMAGVRRYAKEVEGTEAKFIKHPSGWLNDERWKVERVDKPEPAVRHSDANPSPISLEIKRLNEEFLRSGTDG